MEIKKSLKRNEAIDAIRVIAMACVVFIHYGFPGKTGEVISALSRIAVPLFFMISGYYLYGAERKTVLKRAKKACVMMLMYSLIYTLAYACYYGVGFVSSLINLRSIATLLVFNMPLRFMGAIVWYLLSLIYCYLFIAALMKKKCFERIMQLIPLLLIPALAISASMAIFGLDRYDMHYYRNAIFMGLPFIALGYKIHKHEQGSINKTLLQGGVVLGLGLSLIERFFVFDSDIFVGTILASVCLFMLASSSNAHFGWLATVGKRYSAYVYLIHYPLGKLLQVLLQRLNVMDNSAVQWAFPIVILLISLALAMAYDRARAWFKRARAASN